MTVHGIDQVSAGLLCPVQGFIGFPDQVFHGTNEIGRIGGNAHADSDLHPLERSGEKVRLYPGAETFGDQQSIFKGGLRQYQYKLFASVTGSKIVAPQADPGEAGNGHQ